MFDIGFWELGLIAVVALLVIGPERLPGVARTAGKWIGTARRFMSSVKADISEEVNKADTLKRLLEEQAKINSLTEILETKIGDEDDRKPVPSVKPDYAAKTLPDESVEESARASSNEEQKEQGTEQKHD